MISSARPVSSAKILNLECSLASAAAAAALAAADCTPAVLWLNAALAEEGRDALGGGGVGRNICSGRERWDDIREGLVHDIGSGAQGCSAAVDKF